jgi:glutamate-1-semialdehyde 2,1-aminomutase
MAAGKAMLRAYDGEAIERLNRLGDTARAQLRDALAESGIGGQVTGESSLFLLSFTEEPFHDYRSHYRATADRHHRIMGLLFPKLINRGVLMAAWGYGCLSTPMEQAEIDHLSQAVYESLREVRDELAEAAE